MPRRTRPRPKKQNPRNIPEPVDGRLPPITKNDIDRYVRDLQDRGLLIAYVHNNPNRSVISR